MENKKVVFNPYWRQDKNYIEEALVAGLSFEDIEDEQFILREISINGEFRGMTTAEEAREAVLENK